MKFSLLGVVTALAVASVSQAIPAPAPHALVGKPRYYFPRVIKRDITGGVNASVGTSGDDPSSTVDNNPLASIGSGVIGLLPTNTDNNPPPTESPVQTPAQGTDGAPTDSNAGPTTIFPTDGPVTTGGIVNSVVNGLTDTNTDDSSPTGSSSGSVVLGLNTIISNTALLSATDGLLNGPTDTPSPTGTDAPSQTDAPTATDGPTQTADSGPTAPASTDGGLLSTALSDVGNVLPTATGTGLPLTSDVASLTDGIPSITDNVPSITNNVPSITNDVGSLTSDVPSITNDVGSLTNDAPSITNDVGSITSDAPSITNDLPTPTLTNDLPTPTLTNDPTPPTDTSGPSITQGEESPTLTNGPTAGQPTITDQPTQQPPTNTDGPSITDNGPSITSGGDTPTITSGPAQPTDTGSPPVSNTDNGPPTDTSGPSSPGISGPGTGTAPTPTVTDQPPSDTAGPTGASPTQTEQPSVTDEGSQTAEVTAPAATSSSDESPSAGPESIVPTGVNTETALPTETSILSATSQPTEVPQASASVIPSSLPKLISPTGGVPDQPDNSTLIQLGFTYGLNYQFVVSSSTAIAQIFSYLPAGVANGISIANDQVVMQYLQPYNTLPTLGYITTLAMAYIPTSEVSSLSLALLNANSPLYNDANPSVKTLMTMIDPSIPLLAGSSNAGGAPISSSNGATTSSSNPNAGGAAGDDNGNSNSGIRPSSVGIGVGVVAGAAVYGAAMFFIARRYKKKKAGHRRTSSVLTGSTGSSMSRANEGTDLMAGIRDSYGTRLTSAHSNQPMPGRGSRNSDHSRETGRNYISPPVMAENSLGWN